VPKISEEAKEARREAILEAARRCFADHGFEGATVARLEAGTGLSRGAIFNYFESKEHLFLALADRDAERFAQQWLHDGFEEVLRTLLSEDPAWLGVYFEVGRRLRTDEAFRERWSNRTPDFEQRLAERLQGLQEAGELRTDVGWKTIARFMSIVADGVAIRRATGFETDDAEDLIALAADAVRPRTRHARVTGVGHVTRG
jgi:TetR/AcrR family transcriptional regulator, transcriptional repressor of aconitase